MLQQSEGSTEAKQKEIRLSNIISNNFYTFFKTSKPYKVLKGGRSSLKSSATSIKLVTKFLQDDNANIVGFRKVGKYLHTSVYQQIRWAINILGVSNEFRFLKSPLKIEHKRTKTCFYFFGVDEPEKLKSAKIEKGYVTDLWFEEAAEFDGYEEIDSVVITFVREFIPDGKNVDVYFTYNPPRNPYNWINEWAEQKKEDDDYYVHHSTYEDDSLGVLSEQFLRMADKIKVTDPDYWDWVYGGKITGLGDVIYNIKLLNKINELPELPDNDRIILSDLAIDTGYSTSATTFLFIGYTMKRRIVLLDTYYYSPINKVRKKAPSEFSKDLYNFIKSNTQKYKVGLDQRIIDSAEAALRNQYYKDYGQRLSPAKKKQKQKMIENVEDLLAQNRVYMLNNEANRIFYTEHRDYRWEEKSLKTEDPKPIKEDDHTCDAFQYYVNNNLVKLGLKG